MYLLCGYVAGMSEVSGMRARVQKWGNSLAIRIPKAFAREVGIEYNTTVELSLIDGGLLVEPAPEFPVTLEELIAGVTDANRHGEVDTGAPQGSEVW